MVVTPVATATVHNVAAGSAAVAAVNVMVAVEAPEFETAAVKLVVPHPSVVGTAGDDSTNSGRTIVSSSPVEISAFSWKINTNDDAVEMPTSVSRTVLNVMAGVLSWVDDCMETVAMSVDPECLICIVRDTSFNP